ncbi:MAG: type II toxin-antitoxin system VapC family toxin [Rhodothermales bacterium]|nr:type II toxin-antitoxin system VapC family toxin [Rhodothermales bacterium]
MILADTSVWIDFLRGDDDRLAEWLNAGIVAVHPVIIGELACGTLRSRKSVLEQLGRLHHVPIVSHDEALHFIDVHRLHGRGLGIVDVYLLASTFLSGYARIETRDKALAETAGRLGVGSG